MAWNRLSDEPKKICFNCKYWNPHNQLRMQFGVCEHPNEPSSEKYYTGTCDWFEHYREKYLKGK